MEGYLLVVVLCLFLFLFLAGCPGDGQSIDQDHHLIHMDDYGKNDTSEEPPDLNYTSELPNLEFETYEAINEVREEHGFEKLIWAKDLAAIARQHSRDMVEYGFFNHTNPGGFSPQDRIENAGLHYSFSSENLFFAYNVEKDELVETSVVAWMNSTGHRENILDDRPIETGVGIAVSNNGTYYFTHLFMARAYCGYIGGSCCEVEGDDGMVFCYEPSICDTVEMMCVDN